MATEKRTGTIRVGDEFEWCYHGHEGWPHASCRIRVTGIRTAGGDPAPEVGDDRDDAEGVRIECRDIDRGQSCWNSLDVFRDMCRPMPMR